MKLEQPDDKPIPIHDYEFTYSNGRTLVITVFPTMGDTGTVVEDDDTKGWRFNFPRLHEMQEVYMGPNLLSFLKREQLRVYLDPKEVVRRVMEERTREAAEKTKKEVNGEAKD